MLRPVPVRLRPTVRTNRGPRLSIVALAALVVGFSSLPVLTQDGDLTPEEAIRLVDLLLSSQKDFVAALEDTPADAWNWKPAPDRWSVAECAEHIVRTERTLFETAKRALAAPADPDWRAKTAGKAELITRVMPDRSGPRAQAPQEVRPTEGLSRVEVLARFHRTRAELLELLQQEDLPLHRHLEEHPFPVFGWLSAYEWTIYVPLHTIRHTRQILEVQGSEGWVWSRADGYQP